MSGRLEDVAEVGGEICFRVDGRMADFSQRCRFLQGYFLEGQGHHRCGERVSPVFEWQAVVLTVV